MGVFDPNYKRLGLIVFLWLMLTCMYTVEGVFLGKETPLMQIKENNLLYRENIDRDIDSQGMDLLSLINFITYTSPEIPAPMQIFLAPIVTIMLIVAIYLTIDIIYDIVKAFPFT